MTGPKFVKSWLIDELLPCATDVYTQMGKDLGQAILHDLPIWCHLQNINKENLWQSRMIDPGYEHHLIDPQNEEEVREVKKVFQKSNHWGIVNSAKYVSVADLLRSYRKRWLNAGLLKEQNVQLSSLIKKGDLWHYDNHQYEHVILALGYKGATDQWFSTDSYNLVKGDLAICRIKNLPTNKVIKNGKFLLPLGNDLYWVGSNYDRSYTSELPDKQELDIIERFLQEEVGLPYEIIEHRSGIRPTIDFRLPLIGEHPEHSGLYLFNGMGTKGVSLAPYFSQLLIKSIASEGTTFKSKGFIKCFG